ncbi:AraC family transcriptional regulator [Janthinobacterium aquaticum]|uniref:AraC family transcriptional regulator n=1 Tax=Janthinobacterium sp. FT58W TaxID=2654254 RepID=UPI0012650DF3|nr:AraC family transcriptional regulator [Janthinobacterium sp. FT58W]KAB8041643.1 helix-turn-helix domain-containing protein [Janthinobacterium sp. FT58W]
MFLHANEPSIAARHQPALVFDYALTRDACQSTLLRGTGLDETAWQGADARLSAAQYLQLLANAARSVDSADTSFMLGQQLLPGRDGALSHALLQAPSLRQALAILCTYHARLCPLLQPRLREAGPLLVLYWTDTYGAPSQLPFLVEMHMTALAAMCRWLAGEPLPWRYCFNRARPRHVEQHEVHLGQGLRFDCQLDAMLIDSHWLDRPWPRGNANACALALREAAQEAVVAPSLLSGLYDYLLEHIRCAPTLERTALHFGVSPATFKRHLARHGSHFQAELDQVRAHKAIYLFQAHGYDNDAVAAYLGFHDATNFRRSFKRWTGQTPQLLRHALALFGAA